MAALNEISPLQLSRLIGTPDCPVILDVRIDGDFAEDPRSIPTAIQHSHTNIETLVPKINKSHVIVSCHKGLKLSQGVAAILRAEGVSCEVLQGGYVG